MALGCNRTDGANVAEVPLQITPPATLTPLEDSPKVVDVSVEQSIAALKVTLVTAVNQRRWPRSQGWSRPPSAGNHSRCHCSRKPPTAATLQGSRISAAWEAPPAGGPSLRRTAARQANTGGGARFTLWTLSVGCETDGQKRAEFQKTALGRDRRPAASEFAAERTLPPSRSACGQLPSPPPARLQLSSASSHRCGLG